MYEVCIVLVFGVENGITSAGADQGFGVGGGEGEIRQDDLRVLLLLSQMFMERMMQEN